MFSFPACKRKMKVELVVFVGCFVKAVKESAVQLSVQCGGKEVD